MTALFSRYPVAMGFVLMFLFTWPLELGLAAQSHGLLPFYFPPMLELFVGYGFIAAAVIASALLYGKSGVAALFKRLLIWRVNWIWYAAALLGPAAFYIAGIGINVLLGGAVPDFSQPFITRLVPPSWHLALAALVFLLYQIFVNGEEFGWRGYALPKLQAAHSALVASLIIGVVWALWHIPKYLVAGDPHDLPYWFFSLNMIGNSILYTWIFNRTRGSLLIMLFLHAGVNTGIVLLPILPAAIGGDTGPLVIAYILQNIAAIAVVLFAGMNFGRTSAK